VKVILRQDVDGLGRKGEICDVANGHFRNLLNPRGLAMKATKGAESQAEAMRRASALRNAETRTEAEEVATKLVPAVITIAAKAGEGGRLFGSVGEIEILNCNRAGMGFEESALAAVAQWRYEPARQNGKPVDVYFTVSVTFELQ